MTYKHPVALLISTILKYLCAIALTAVTYLKTGERMCLIAGSLELIIIFLFSNMLIRQNHIFGWIVNGLLMLLYNIQMVVLMFGSTYISLVMMTNIDSVRDLSGQAAVYIPALAAALILSLIPVRHAGFGKTAEARLLSLFLAAELIFTMWYGSSASPLFAYYTLVRQEIDAQAQTKSLDKGKDYTSAFYSTYIAGNIRLPKTLPEKPNIIVIFTEGLSQNIVADKRNIMPNVATYEKKSINFTNYYNHTFATYRALSGQLYSGFQLNNYDRNTLVSLQDILSDRGYTTTFINTETRNINFTNYLLDMNFDEVISDPEFRSNGPADSISDKDAYTLLFDTVSEKAGGDKPFLTAIYTFGTHTSLDSPDEKFGDGSDTMLNKYYNMDCQFGEFMKKFEESSLADNTIIFFTADHAAYQDRLFRESFPDHERAHTEVDEMPFFIYHKGIEPQQIDVEGRTTLDFTPTIMDYLDISGVENYFLGRTLFSGSDNNNNYDTVFTDSAVFASTRGGQIHGLTESEKGILDVKLKEYYAAKQQEPPSSNKKQ